MLASRRSRTASGDRREGCTRTVVLVACVATLAAAAVLLVIRIALGPTMLDRVIALDVLIGVMICGLALEAALNGT